MARKYGPKASEKIGQTMHEWKRGKLKSGGSGKKVTSREQAIAIGISQARRAGYKVPPEPQGHATMKGSLDARVRSYLGKMRPGQEIDARGIARALGGGTDPLEADYALERAEKAGLAVTSDGRWFGPAGTPSRHHATKRSTLDRDDARGYGQYAYRMEQTKAQALSGARAEGFGAHHLDAVEEGWEAERRDTIRGGFAGDSGHATRKKYPGDVGAYWHATKKKTAAQLDREIAEALAKKPVDQPAVQDLLGHMSRRAKTRVEKALSAERQRLYEQLGYAGNTRDDVRQYGEAIDEINAKLRLIE